jgi:glutamate/tyrosine decarboxylase-like PLP-dependent enzyme
MSTTNRSARIDAETFRALGHRLIDDLADFLSAIPGHSVCERLSPARMVEALGKEPLPEAGRDPREVFDRAFRLLTDGSVLTGHPRFWAYVHGSPHPIAALGDLLAATINSPVTSPRTGPMSSAIEGQTVRWLAELVGFPADCGGILLSGGSMANAVALHAAIVDRAGWDVREAGVASESGRRLRLYATHETHSSVTSAAILLGLGSRAIVRVEADEHGRMRPDDLRARIDADRRAGLAPLAVIGTAGTTSTGAIDPLPHLAQVCAENGLWFHVDGAYGGVARVAPEAPEDLAALERADSLVVDPHKWLYIPLEAGCLLMRDPTLLYRTFRQASSYYSLSGTDEKPLEPPFPLRDCSPQTSRGFRALKVWLALQHLGRDGYQRSISEDMQLARALYDRVQANPALEALTCNLSITTFRFVPPDLAPTRQSHQAYLDTLNQKILAELQASGAAYPSHTSVRGSYVLRVCIVNHNTTLADIEALPDLVVRLGEALDRDRVSADPP